MTCCELEGVSGDDARVAEIKADIARKHAKTKRFMLDQSKRSQEESEYVQKQRDFRKYQKLMETYAYPLHKYRLEGGNL